MQVNQRDEKEMVQDTDTDLYRRQFCYHKHTERDTSREWGGGGGPAPPPHCPPSHTAPSGALGHPGPGHCPPSSSLRISPRKQFLSFSDNRSEPFIQSHSGNLRLGRPLSLSVGNGLHQSCTEVLAPTGRGRVWCELWLRRSVGPD